ncbi:related to ubiE/COQ5 methyltransferase [Phialocephala subalpina]|uniref:Related to ubiE/COQ5 methyltransferase n=1 Tax=Phialocephala subalpina TaxID=576137 RepID=A0A1L7X090_9HELO|nr:related to ubiE/COQ5 methyltransferase [Phialocephala subalpina]
MASSNRLDAIRNRYDKRAPTYDQEKGFHPKQAADYINWMNVQPGFNILDLACGTGAVTVPAAKEAGPSGSVIGIDISSASLDIGREKALKEGLKVTFLEHDIENLKGLEKYGIEEGKFDLITCVSAFALVQDPSEAVRSWGKLLKKGGKLIFDVPAGGSLIKNLLLERVAKELNVSVHSHRLDSAESVKKCLTDAGLDASESFLSDVYDATEVMEINKAGETFDELLGRANWTGDWYRDLAKPGLVDKSRAAFRKEVEKIADKDGKVVSYLMLNMAVGKKL